MLSCRWMSSVLVIWAYICIIYRYTIFKPPTVTLQTERRRRKIFILNLTKNSLEQCFQIMDTMLIKWHPESRKGSLWPLLYRSGYLQHKCSQIYYFKPFVIFHLWKVLEDDPRWCHRFLIWNHYLLGNNTHSHKCHGVHNSRL